MGIWLMTSQELVSVSYNYILLVSFPSGSYPPTASSCPFSVAQVKFFTGRSAIVCQTGWFPGNDKVFLLVSIRAFREQVKTVFVG